MKQSFKAITIGLTLTSSVLMSCTQSETVKYVDRVHIATNDSMSSDELATAAEQLVGPYTFMLAYKTALQATEKDPTNLKAQFYVRFLKRYEAFRGILNRVKPVLKPEQINNLNKFTTKILPNSPLKDFLTDASAAPFTQAADLQNVISEYITALRDFRSFLKENQSKEMNIYLNPRIFQEAIKNEMNNFCKVTPNGDYSTVDCDYSFVASKKLNSADMIALTQMQAGEILMLGIYNSYSLEGLEKLSEADPQHQMSNRERTNFLSNLPNFGKLRKDNIFDLLNSIGADFSAAAKWAMTYQQSLCPKQQRVNNQRPGYLFSSGICVENPTELSRSIALIDQMLQGITRVDLRTPNGSVINTSINAFAWSKSPIQDLRQIRPTTWNNCDYAANLADNSLGGVFVENNFNLFLNQNCNTFKYTSESN